MLRQYRLTVWHIGQRDSDLQFLDPTMVEAADAAEAIRTANSLAGIMLSAGFAAKVMTRRIEGEGVDRSIELPA